MEPGSPSSVWIEELEAELQRRALPPNPATGWALDMGCPATALPPRHIIRTDVDAVAESVGARGYSSESTSYLRSFSVGPKSSLKPYRFNDTAPLLWTCTSAQA